MADVMMESCPTPCPDGCESAHRSRKLLFGSQPGGMYCPRLRADDDGPPPPPRLSAGRAVKDEAARGGAGLEADKERRAQRGGATMCECV